MENTEILVHISAPSGASDGARYRAQVEAILGFQRTVSRQHISVGADADDGNDTISGDSLQPAPARPSSGNGKRLKSDGGQKSEYNGGNDGPNSEIQSATADNANEPGSQHECVTSDSPQVPDSIGQAVPVSNQAVVSPKATTSPQKPHGPAENDSLGTPVSVIPDSQPDIVHKVPERNPEYLDAQPQPPPEPPNPKEHRNSHTTSPSRSKKRRRVDSPKSGNRPKPRSITRPSEEKRSTPKSDTSKVSTKANTTDKRQHQHQQPNIQLTTLPLQIQPPPPPISTSPFTTHITPTLAMLAARLNPSRIYKPIYQTRSLDKLERGHWFLRINVPDLELESEPASDSGSRRSSTIYTTSPKQDQSKPNPATCPHTLLTRLWTFLSRFITQEARAGWGVWCILEEEDTTSPPPPPPPHPQTITPRTGTGARTTTPTETETETENQSPNPTPKSTNLPLNLKIYTWGEISTHIYLLLFLASERRVRGMGAQWRDARGEVIVQMP